MLLLNFFKKIEIFLKKIIAKAENSQINLSSWLLTFLCVVFIRTLLEAFSGRINIFSTKSFYFLFFHSVSFFLYVFLLLILFLYFLTKEKIEKITKTSLFVSILILIPPLIDILVSRGEGLVSKYYFPTSNISFWEAFLGKIEYGLNGLFLGAKDLSQSIFTANYGVRIELLILALLIICYVFLKTKNPLKIVLSFFLLYPAYFLIGSLPYWLQRIAGVASLYNISTFNPEFEWDSVLFSVYLILIFIFGSLWFFIYQKEKFIAVVKNLRFFRTLQILALLFFGLYLAHVSGARLRFFDFLLIATACLSVISYWAWGVFSNDLIDENSDRITNPGRPLAVGKLNRQEVKTLSIIFLIISYMSALAVGYAFFITVFLRSCLGYLYSFHPFRLKRIPILATFVLACASLTTIWGGYLLVKQNSIYSFPVKVILLVLVAFSLGFSAKDIKDYEGDKKDNVKTILVIFGLERGKKIIGVLSFICFLLPPIIFFQYFKPLIGIAIIAGLLSYYLINKREYSERPLLVLYFLYAIPIALYIFNY